MTCSAFSTYLSSSASLRWRECGQMPRSRTPLKADVSVCQGSDHQIGTRHEVHVGFDQPVVGSLLR